jgi:hypothetical protein
MKNLLQTHSISYADSIKVALETEGIGCGSHACGVRRGLMLIFLGPRANRH